MTEKEIAKKLIEDYVKEAHKRIKENMEKLLKETPDKNN